MTQTQEKTFQVSQTTNTTKHNKLLLDYCRALAVFLIFLPDRRVRQGDNCSRGEKGDSQSAKGGGGCRGGEDCEGGGGDVSIEDSGWEVSACCIGIP